MVLVLVFAAGCAGAPPSEVSAVEKLQRELSQRLVGQWRLERYDAATTLGKVLMSKILQESIVVRFDGSRVRSSAGGMRLDRAYRLESVGPSSFRITVFDEHGVGQASIGTYQGDSHILFVSNNPPWAGTGRLVRVAP